MCICTTGLVKLKHVGFVEFDGQNVRRTGGVLFLRHHGVLNLPEHKPTGVQGVRPVDGAERRLGVRRRGGRAARGRAHQRLEGPLPESGAHCTGHGRGHVERPARTPAQTANRAASGRPDGHGYRITVLRDPVVGVTGHDGFLANGLNLTVRRLSVAVHGRQRVRGRHHF